MPTTNGKPIPALHQPDRSPAGCVGYFLLNEGVGATARDLSGRLGKDGTLVGSTAALQAAIWQRGPYGAQVGGFGTTEYIGIDPPRQPIATGVWPFWMAVLAMNGNSTTDGVAFGAGRSSNNNPASALRWNTASASNVVSWFLRDDAATGGPGGGSNLSFTSAQASDGNFHVLHAVSRASNDHRLYWDGRLVSQNTTALGTTTLDLLTIGLLRRVATAFPFPGLVAAAALGRGAMPDPMLLASDWLSGAFLAARTRPRGAGIFAAISAGGASAVPAMMASYRRRRSG